MLPKDKESSERMLQIFCEALAYCEYNQSPEVIEQTAKTLAGYPSNVSPGFPEELILLEHKYREQLENPSHHVHNSKYLYEPTDGKDGTLYKITNLNFVKQQKLNSEVKNV